MCFVISLSCGVGHREYCERERVRERVSELDGFCDVVLD